jgi:hypothetical protein
VVDMPINQMRQRFLSAVKPCSGKLEEQQRGT